jgi:hypothetical protein
LAQPKPQDIRDPETIRYVVWMFRFAIRKAQPAEARLPFALYERNNSLRP